MRPTNFSFGTADIPIKAFGEARSVSGSSARRVLVHVEDVDGVVGIGEGCPPGEAGGETMETALAYLHRRRHVLAGLGDPTALAGWIQNNGQEVNENAAAFCAAELALLDLFSRQSNRSIEQLFVAPHLAAPLKVSAVHASGPFLTFHRAARAFDRWGMTDAVLRLSGRSGADARRAAFLARKGKVRLDAANRWPDAKTAIAALKPLARHAWAVEEPVARGDWDGMRAVHEETGLSIIADESFRHQGHLDLMPPGEAYIPCFRVSKIGGLMRSVSALRNALDQNRKVIIGADPGESTILTRAGLLLAGGAADKLAGYEGAYGRLLLKQDIVEPQLAFGLDGKLDPGSLQDQVGLGLQIRPDAKPLMQAAKSDDYWMPAAASA